MRYMSTLGILAVSALALAGCAGSPEPPSDALLTNEEIAMLSGPDREQILVEGAKAEGSLVFYTQLIEDQAARPLADAFQKKYPFIKVDLFRASGGEIVDRLVNEDKAGQNRADIFAGNSAGALVTSGLAEAATSPLLEGIPKNYLDPDAVWAPIYLTSQVFAYNPDKVKESDVPSTYEDLLDPKWGNGRFALSSDPGGGGPFLISALRAAWGEQKALDFFEKLAAQKPVAASGSVRAVLDFVEAGEYDAMLQAQMHHAKIDQRAGIPVGIKPLLPMASQITGEVLLKNAPHPYAAMLFFDFLLDSEGGQRILANVGYFPVASDLKEEFAAPSADQISLLMPSQTNEMREESVKIYNSLFTQ